MRQNPTPRRPGPGWPCWPAGWLLLVAGIGLVAWVLASSAGLAGRDDPVMADPTATTAAAPGTRPGPSTTGWSRPAATR